MLCVCAAVGITLDFANGDQWSAADDQLPPSCVLGVRVLARHLLGISVSTLRIQEHLA